MITDSGGAVRSHRLLFLCHGTAAFRYGRWSTMFDAHFSANEMIAHYAGDSRRVPSQFALGAASPSALGGCAVSEYAWGTSIGKFEASVADLAAAFLIPHRALAIGALV